MFETCSSSTLAAFGAVVLCYQTFKLMKWVTLMLRCYAFPTYPDFTKYGKWAVITGGGDGIGKAVAHQLAGRGMSIAIISLLPDQLREVSEDIEKKYNVEVRTLQTDFDTSDPKIYEDIRDFLSGLDDIGVLVNNVGFSPPIYEFSEVPNVDRICHSILNVNVLPMCRMTQLILPGMKQRRRGLIMNMSSIAARRPMPFMAIYGSTKSLICHFSESLALENADYGIEIQTVMPSLVRTRLTYEQDLSFFNVAPSAFARSLMGTVGKMKKTSGCFAHEIRTSVVYAFIPDFMFVPILRKRAQQFEQIQKEKYHHD